MVKRTASPHSHPGAPCLHHRRMNLEEMTRAGRAGYEDARYQFIVTELELALTFANIALSSRDPDNQQRNLKHAHQAYNAATQRLDERALPPRRKRSVDGRLRELKKTVQEDSGARPPNYIQIGCATILAKAEPAFFTSQTNEAQQIA